MSNAVCQTDFIKPSDFDDNPPNFPNVVLPSFSSEKITEKDTISPLNNFEKGYRVQIIISQNENDLIEIQNELLQKTDEKIYIIFELPNYKLRIGNFISRKEAENFQSKIVKLGYKTAWVVPTLVEMDN